MTQEDIQLLLILLKDLCARLPYKVKIQTWYGEIITSDLNIFPLSMEEMDKEDMWNQLSGFKPYLRSMSSMTEEESKEFALLQTDFYVDGFLYPIAAINMVNWLNKHYFDYRGLIPMGLALEAPEGMYK